jgi:septation ring formation regulator EzrA
MTTTDDALASLNASLKPDSKVKINVDALKAKIEHLKQVDPSLVNLPSVCDEILKFIGDIEQSQTLIEKLDGFAFDMAQLNKATSENLVAIKNVQDSLMKRIQNFGLMEEKYERLINRVDSVLGELETVLRRS